MDLDQKLRDYHIGQFTDDDVVRCTGLSARGWRELIKFKVVRTIVENDRGRGHIRLCDTIVFKRAAVIAALCEAGFSLAVAGRIAYFVPFHWSLFEICDPGNVSVRGATVSDSHRVLPLRLRKANAKWFNPARPATVDPKTDWLVQIHDRRFVSVVYPPAKEPVVFGDLRQEGTKFVAWVPRYAKSHFVRSVVAQLAMELAPAGDRYPDVVSEWEEPTKQAKELRRLGYEYKMLGAEDPLRKAAQAAARNPLFTTNINISLAIRRAIRRYLDIEHLRPASATEVAAERRTRKPAKHNRRSSK